MKYEKLAEDLLNEVGGAANVIDSYHCVTRLRLTLVNTARADTARIALLDDVVGAQVKGDELQVIIGPGVADAYAAFTRRLPAEKRSVRPPAPAASPAETPGPSLASRIIGFLAGVFVPIIPALAGAGMVKSLIALLTALGWLPADSGVAAVLNIVGDGVFYFLPFFLAVSAARRVKTNEYLALAVATSLLYPTLTAGAAAGAEPLSFLGLPLPMVNYASSVIPILLGVVLLSIVSRLLDRFVHRNIKIVVVPLLSLLIVIPVTLTLLAPLGYYAGTLLASGVEWIFSVSGIVASAVLGAALPLIVMTGMHAVFAPIILGNLGSSGIDVILPLFFFGSLAVSGAALAVFVRTRDAKRKATALSSGLSAFIGITEPATYGVNLPLRRPFVAAMIGGGIASAIAFAMGVRAFAYAMPSVLSIPTYLDAERGSTIGGVLVGMAIAFFVSFAITVTWWREPVPVPETDAALPPLTLTSPVAHGIAVSVAGVADEAFATQTLGATLAFSSDDGVIVAPVDGEVVAVAATGHAVGLRTADGVEILIHVGVDTVGLGRTFFALDVTEGSTVAAGQTMMTADVDAIRARAVDDTVLMVITNRDSAELRPIVAEGSAVSTGAQVAVLDGVRVARS